MKKITLLFFLLNFLTLSSQSLKKSNNWFFGNGIGLNFNFQPPSVFYTNNTSQKESNSSYSDSNGSLIMYYYDDTIFDKDYKMIPNGFGIKGYQSSAQGSLILKHLSNDSIYFLFTVVPCSTLLEEGLYLTKVKIINNSYFVIEKNIKISNSATEKLNAVNHHNGKDIWVISHKCNSSIFDLFLLKKDGILDCNIQQDIGINLAGNSTAASYLKFSPSGNYLAHTTFVGSKLEIFNFNTRNGNITNKISLTESLPLGVEFSNNEKYLYMFQVYNKNISQYSLKNYSNSDILNSKIILYSNTNNFFRGHCLQLASDRKIYFSVADSNFLSCINEPDSQGVNCKFVRRQVELGNKKNDIGLVNFNQSYFYTPAINYNYEMECINNNIKFWGYDTFAANTHFWQTRKLYSVNSYSLIGTTKDINYTFTDTGSYEIRYIANNGTKKDTIVKTITIYPKINKQFLGKDTTYFQGSAINKTLTAPYGMYCQIWQDTSGLSTFTAIKKGIYTCKITTQAFCEVTDTIEIKECLSLSIPSIYKKLTDSLFCSHQDADTFIWYRNNVPYKTTYAYGTKTSNLKLTDTGNYRVEALKYGHCNRTSATFYINKLGVKGLTIGDFGIKVYPNPSSGLINIESERLYKLRITDIAGRIMLDTENTKQIELSKGIYFLYFEIYNSQIVEKIIIF